MAGKAPSSDRLWLAFAVSSVACLAVLAVSPVKDHFREYRHYQNEHRSLLLEAASTAQELHRAQVVQVGVRQIWLPQLGNRVDRCPSCHLGVDDASMASAPQPHRLHVETPHTPADIDRFGCVVCHRGQGRATSREEAHGEVVDWDSPLLPLPYVEASCGVCHRGEVPEAALLSRGRALIERAGCLGCHELRSAEPWESTAPSLDGLAQKTHPEWLRAWLASPQELRPGTWMPDFQLSDEEVEALAAFLWVQPPVREVETDDELPAGDYERGRTLFRESRCISCHTVDGRGNGSAPELGGIGSKVKRNWLVAYVAEPHLFEGTTPMPRYHFSRQELLDLSQYMMEDLVDPSAPAPEAPFRPAQNAIEEGERLYVKYGCAGCHRIAGREDVAQTGPTLTGIGAKPVKLLDFGARRDLPRRLPDWLAAKLAAPRSFREELRMPEFGFDEDELTALVTALLSATGEEVPEDYRVATVPTHAGPPPVGRFGELVRRYRCLSCHEIRGLGADISTAPLTFEGSKVKRQWLEEYLLLPTAIRPILTDRMIPLRMPQEEASFLAEMMSNVYLDDGIPMDLLPRGPAAEQAARGRRLFFERYGCQSCHQVEGTGGYYGPPLDGSPEKLHAGWIVWWLEGPQRWRDDVRCPDFGLAENDAYDLAAFLVSVGKPPGAGAGGAP